MTPQQKKADELVERYLPLITMVDKYSYVLKHESNSLAIQCAIICVEEILEIKSVDKDYDLNEYWQSVLNELKSRL